MNSNWSYFYNRMTHDFYTAWSWFRTRWMSCLARWKKSSELRWKIKSVAIFGLSNAAVVFTVALSCFARSKCIFLLEGATTKAQIHGNQRQNEQSLHKFTVNNFGFILSASLFFSLLPMTDIVCSIPPSMAPERWWFNPKDLPKDTDPSNSSQTEFEP